MPLLANGKHEAVAQAYIADPERIGWRAYRKVYPNSSQHTAESAWSALMKNPEFSARVAELAEAAAQDAVMTASEVLLELSKVGRADMADYIRAFACGDPVEAVEKLTPAQTRALGEVTVEQFWDGHGDDAREVRRIKFKLLPKIPALDLLGKHHKLYTDRVEHTGKDGGPVEVKQVTDIEAARLIGRLLSKVTKDRQPPSGDPVEAPEQQPLRQPDS